jgi:bifunctional DNA-binding transcriptional regulator/antitoxin component of YhaV-PrlF toxin-antitoxin module
VAQMVLLMEKTYDNEKGHFYIPVVWREEFNLQDGIEVGIDFINGIIVIDKMLTREYSQKVSARGKLTIPLEVRQLLQTNNYNIYVIQKDKKIILSPK